MVAVAMAGTLLGFPWGNGSNGEGAAVQHPQIFMGYKKQQVDLQVAMGSNGSKLCQVGSRSSWRLPQKMSVSLRDTPPRALEGWQESRRAASQPPVPQDRAVMEMMAHAALCWHR